MKTNPWLTHNVKFLFISTLLWSIKAEAVHRIICSKSTTKVGLFEEGCERRGDVLKRYQSQLIKLSDACKSTADRSPPRRQPVERDTDRRDLTGDHPG